MVLVSSTWSSKRLKYSFPVDDLLQWRVGGWYCTLSPIAEGQFQWAGQYRFPRQMFLALAISLSVQCSGVHTSPGRQLVTSPQLHILTFCNPPPAARGPPCSTPASQSQQLWCTATNTARQLEVDRIRPKHGCPLKQPHEASGPPSISNVDLPMYFASDYTFS